MVFDRWLGAEFWFFYALGDSGESSVNFCLFWGVVKFCSVFLG